MALKYFDKYYIAIAEYTTVNGNHLAFAVPDGNDSAAKKRKQTVDNWASNASKSGQGQVYDNKPMTGFEIVSWAGRYTTENKVARVYDPRGFELEIYIPNLLDLILNTTMVNGVIKDELVWIRDGANNRLVPSASGEFKEANTKPVKPKKLRHKPGDIVDSQGSKYLYLGLLDIEYIIPSGERVYDEKATAEFGTTYFDRGMFSTLKQTGRPPQVHTKYYKINPEKTSVVHDGRRHVYIPEPTWWVLREKHPNGWFDHNTIVTRKSQITTYDILSSDNDLPDIGEQNFFVTNETLYYNSEIVGESAKHGMEGVDYWEAFNVRLKDGKFETDVDPSDIRTFEFTNENYFRKNA